MIPGVVFNGVGKVWDAARSRVLCHFTDGKYETSDAREIEILSGLGYEHALPPTEAPEEPPLDGAEEGVETHEIGAQHPVKRPRGRPRNA